MGQVYTDLVKHFQGEFVQGFQEKSLRASLVRGGARTRLQPIFLLQGIQGNTNLARGKLFFVVIPVVDVTHHRIR